MGFQENEGNNTGIFGEKNLVNGENAPGNSLVLRPGKQAPFYQCGTALIRIFFIR
jgi:hypothetical protein